MSWGTVRLSLLAHDDKQVSHFTARLLLRDRMAWPRKGPRGAKICDASYHWRNPRVGAREALTAELLWHLSLLSFIREADAGLLVRFNVDRVHDVLMTCILFAEG